MGGAGRRLAERGGACGRGRPGMGNGIGGVPQGLWAGQRALRGGAPGKGRVEASPCPQDPQG